MLNVLFKYSIKFPEGSTIIMTLKSIHETKSPYDIKYIFIDKDGIKVKLTEGVCKRLKIREYKDIYGDL